MNAVMSPLNCKQSLPCSHFCSWCSRKTGKREDNQSYWGKTGMLKHSRHRDWFGWILGHKLLLPRTPKDKYRWEITYTVIDIQLRKGRFTKGNEDYLFPLQRKSTEELFKGKGAQRMCSGLINLLSALVVVTETRVINSIHIPCSLLKYNYHHHFPPFQEETKKNW